MLAQQVDAAGAGIINVALSGGPSVDEIGVDAILDMSNQMLTRLSGYYQPLGSRFAVEFFPGLDDDRNRNGEWPSLDFAKNRLCQEWINPARASALIGWRVHWFAE
jgi:hypothetical protein